LLRGEQLLVSVSPLNGRKVSKIVVNTPRSKFEFVAKKVRSLEKNTFTINSDGKVLITFHNNNALPLNAFIKIEKIKPTEYENPRMLDDLIFTVTEDSIQRVVVDTIPWPDIIEHEMLLAPARNLDVASSFCVTDTFLGEGVAQYAAYWVGIGDEALAAYDEIKSNPPPIWIMNGINEPLVAFGMGLTKSLPVSSSPLSQNVVFQVRNPTSIVDPAREWTLKEEQSQTFGYVSTERAMKYNSASFCARNFNTLTGVKVHIKVARFTIYKKTVYDRVVRERAQEVFIERPVPKKETEE